MPSTCGSTSAVPSVEQSSTMMTSKRVCSSAVCKEARHACVYSNWLNTGITIETSTSSCCGKQMDDNGNDVTGALFGSVCVNLGIFGTCAALISSSIFANSGCSLRHFE